MIKNKIRLIEIHEWTSFISVKIHEGGDYPRVRSASTLKYFNEILKDELSHARSLGYEPQIKRSGVGKFGGIKYKDLHKLKSAWQKPLTSLYYNHEQKTRIAETYRRKP